MATKSAAAKAAEEEASTTEEVDPRAAALAALTGPTPDAPAAAEPAPELVGDTEDFGGDLVAVVLTSRYNGHVDGIFKQARKGASITVTRAALDRGVAIGALRALDGK